MECVICGNLMDSNIVIFGFSNPDKYEKWLGIGEGKKCLGGNLREWIQCFDCGHYQQVHSYDISVFDRMYQEGYRAEDFRGKTIKQAFQEVKRISWHESENGERIRWIENVLELDITRKKILDIGSGFGIFPFEISKMGHDIECIEPNKDSRVFIAAELNIPCWDKFDENVHKNFDIVSIIHVLEHMQYPEVFLYEARKALVSNGMLFIEVPDSIEFKYLDKSNDEFNSLHLHFFNVANLYNLVERCGFNVTDIHRVHYTERDLRRILLLAEKKRFFGWV